jgi:glucokinase
MNIKLSAAIDIGGTNTVYGLVDVRGNIHSRGSVPTTDSPDAEALVKTVCLKIKDLIYRMGPDVELIGAGIGAPNGNYFSGCIEFAPNLNWKGIVPLAKYFNENLGVKAVLTNDANAAALGEMLFGGARGMKDFLFVTLGTGLGSGIVVNGELVYGHDGMAGELGHVILIPEGRVCGCGRKGCVETYCSATGIRTTYLQLTGKVPDAKIDAKYIYEKALEGEKQALESFTLTGEWLGLALANSVAYTSPSAIFLFGGLAMVGEMLFAPTKKSFENNLLRVYQNKIKLLPSSLSESDAALLGSASLIWKTSI